MFILIRINIDVCCGCGVHFRHIGKDHRRIFYSYYRPKDAQRERDQKVSRQNTNRTSQYEPLWMLRLDSQGETNRGLVECGWSCVPRWYKESESYVNVSHVRPYSWQLQFSCPVTKPFNFKCKIISVQTKGKRLKGILYLLLCKIINDLYENLTYFPFWRFYTKPKRVICLDNRIVRIFRKV